MKHRNIFTVQNQAVVSLFASAGHPNKVLCVALDYAKETHMALCCNGAGKTLKSAFPVKSSEEGLVFLLETVEGLCRKHNMERRHVYFGGEDCGTFSSNFIYALRSKGFLVIGVNAERAAGLRENLQASSDELDLLGIAQMLVNKQGKVAGGVIGAERALRSLTRHRREMVRMQTAAGNRIHAMVDQLLPGFLDERKSGIPPFSEASLYLMEDRFSAADIGRRQDKPLLKALQKCGLQQAEEAMKKLKAYVAQVLVHPAELVGMLQSALASEIRLYRCLEANIEQIHREVAQQLALTPGAMLTTIRGIGITIAAGVAAEIGDPVEQPSIRRLSSLAGIVPKTKQTGGPEGLPITGRVSKRCNRILKDYIVQGGNHLGQHGPADLKEDHRRRKANKQHADFGMARRLLRMGMRLMKNNESYVPPGLRHGAELDDLRAYYQQLWVTLCDKWVKAGAAQTAFKPENPLGQWRERIQEIHEIKLPLPRKK